MTNIITINCLVRDQSTQNAFAVDIDKTKLISHLKNEIKNANPNDFHNVDSRELKLWKVNIPSDADTQLLVLEEIEAGAIQRLIPTFEIEAYLPKPERRHIHDVVELPPCKNTYLPSPFARDIMPSIITTLYSAHDPKYITFCCHSNSLYHSSYSLKFCHSCL